MIYYEVNLKIEPAIEKDVIKYMTEKHIPDVMATGYFNFAVIEKSPNSYRNRYEIDSQEKLQEYLEKDASRLREDVSRHFPSGIEFSRDIFESIAEFHTRSRS